MKAALRIAGIFLLILSFTSISKAAQTMNTQALNPKQQAMVAIAAFSANGDLEKLKEKGYDKAYNLHKKPNLLLSTILITNNFVNVAIVIISTYLVNSLFFPTIRYSALSYKWYWLPL